MSEHIDKGSLLVIFLTFFFFIIALWLKGVTKDLLLELGVLLVSIKLIMMAYKNSKTSNEIMKELREIKKIVKAKDDNN